MSPIVKKVPVLRSALALLLLLVTASFSSPLWAAGSSTVVISQLYGAGGNSGSTYNADYIELLNRGTTAVSLNGYALQYASATGTAISTTVVLPAGITLQPGQYFLIAAAAGTGADLPTTPDLVTTSATGVLALAATAGKIYLTNTATSITNICSANTAIVDFVGFGTTANCFEGTKYAPAPSTTTADIRAGGGCTDTDDNSADFTAGTIAPHNSKSTFASCGGGSTPTAISLTASILPTTVAQNSTALLTAKVTAGATPASTGITVTADTTAFGGTTAATLYDDGTHGDVTANDNTFSLSLTVPSTTAVNTYTINVKAADAQLRTATASTTLAVTANGSYTAIHTIQGSVPGASTYVGQVVTTQGIITGVRVNGFYLQARDSAADSDPTTSEAIYVHTGTGLVPATAAIGTEMSVSGTVTLYPTAAVRPGTELDTVSGFTVLSTGNALPTPITLTSTFPSPTGGTNQLYYYQSMRMTAASMTTTSGTEDTNASFDEANETYGSGGVFWATVSGVARPVREPGLEVLDPLTAGQPTTIARFDDNPEIVHIDSTDMVGAPAPLDLTTNTLLTGVSGIMDFSSGAPLLTLDAATRPTVSGGMVAVPVAVAATGEVTIGDLNMERFYNTTKDTAGAVVLSTEAYTRRLKKASLAIRNVLRTPDILALEEVENLATLTDLSTQISSDAGAGTANDPAYVPYLTVGNDSSGISVGYLIKPSKITVNDVTQFGKTTTFVQPSTGSNALLNDRPPLVLHAGIKRKNTTDYPITVIVNHLRSLNNVTDTTGTGQNTRAKREQQAEYLANLIQGYQKAGEHIVTVGDYNAFEFNDGLVDSLDIIRGIVVPANQDVVAGPTTPLVSPALVDLAPTNIAKGDYSYVFVGNAQSIDHILVTADIAPLMHTSPAHLNADFPVVLRNDATRPERTSDHDGIVAYIAVPGLTQVNVSPTGLTFGTQIGKTTSASQPVTVQNLGTTALTITSIVTTANFGQTNNCGTSLAGGATCTINVTFTPTAAGTLNGTLTVTDSDVTGTQVVTLTGLGAGVTSAVTLTPSATSVLFGTGVTFTANITGNSTPAIGGTVTFTENGATIGTGTVTAGVASFSTSTLSVGTHNIVANYSGDGTYPPATSTAASVVVNAITSSITLSASTTSAVSGTSLTFKATVTGNTTPAPSGVVTFLDGTTTLGTGTLASGSASFTTGTLALGTHTITAVYAGDTIYPKVTSASVTVTITAPPVPDFTFSVSNAQLLATSGQRSATSVLNVAMVNGFSQTVSFSCSGLPANSRCSFAPATLAASGSTTLTVSINTASSALAPATRFSGGERTMLAFLLLGLPLALRKRSRKLRSLVALVLLGAAMAAISGCGSSLTTPTSTSTVTVNAVGGGVTHTAAFTLTVQ